MTNRMRWRKTVQSTVHWLYLIESCVAWEETACVLTDCGCTGRSSLWRTVVDLRGVAMMRCTLRVKRVEGNWFSGRIAGVFSSGCLKIRFSGFLPGWKERNFPLFPDGTGRGRRERERMWKIGKMENWKIRMSVLIFRFSHFPHHVSGCQLKSGTSFPAVIKYYSSRSRWL